MPSLDYLAAHISSAGIGTTADSVCALNFYWRLARYFYEHYFIGTTSSWNILVHACFKLGRLSFPGVAPPPPPRACVVFLGDLFQTGTNVAVTDADISFTCGCDTPAPVTTPAPAEPSSFPTEVVVGGSVGAVALLAIVGCGVWACKRGRNQPGGGKSGGSPSAPVNFPIVSGPVNPPTYVDPPPPKARAPPRYGNARPPPAYSESAPPPY